MAARVDLEMARELGVSAVVVQTTAAEHLRDEEHITWSEVQGGQRRKEYTEAGRALLRSLLVPAPAEKAPAEQEAADGLLHLPGLGFTLWIKRPVMLRIVRMCPNPTFVVVKAPDGKVADVRVRHSRMLVPGKMLACSPLPAGGWECADRMLSPNPAWRL